MARRKLTAAEVKAYRELVRAARKLRKAQAEATCRQDEPAREAALDEANTLEVAHVR